MLFNWINFFSDFQTPPISTKIIKIPQFLLHHLLFFSFFSPYRPKSTRKIITFDNTISLSSCAAGTFIFSFSIFHNILLNFEPPFICSVLCCLILILIFLFGIEKDSQILMLIFDFLGCCFFIERESGVL